MTTKICKLCQIFRGKYKQIYVLSTRNLSAEAEKNSWKAVPNAEVKRFIVDCMTKVGTKRTHAASLAENLTAADYRGHYSHGLNRLGL